MGTLTYDVDHKLDIDDRTLAHLQIVIGTELRRGESFNFTWIKDVSAGSGRTTIWLDPAISLTYDFRGSKQAVINRAWIEALMTTANSTAGLSIVPEPAAAQAQAAPVIAATAQVTVVTEAPAAAVAVAEVPADSATAAG
jgi:hypothetical protein